MYYSLHLQDYLLIAFVLTAIIAALITVIAMFRTEMRERRRTARHRYRVANR